MNSRAPAIQSSGVLEQTFPVLAGALLGLSLLKFGNPVVFADRIATPANPLETFFNAWPLAWGYIIFAALMIIALPFWRPPRAVPSWVLILPGLWLASQLIATIFSIDRPLSNRTFMHFASVAAAFYLGAAVLAKTSRLRWLWIFALSAFGLVLVIGFYQHFIGLEETRRYFYAYELPNYPRGVPPELLKKLASNRIYSTLFYPNTFAATILLWSPLLVHHALNARATIAARATLAGLAILGAGLCLAWSGSKAGCLIALLMGVPVLFRLHLNPRIRLIALVSLCIVGLVGFTWRYSGYLQRGATSASARLDYWRAGLRAFRERPFTGYGPGTFMLVYKRLKPPEAEMTRLAHNDYLQQASDSGLAGFITFSGFIAASLYLLYKKQSRDALGFAAWLGIAAVSVHGIMEFNLYVPAVAWSQFLLFGWLWGRESGSRNPLRTSAAPNSLDKPR